MAPRYRPTASPSAKLEAMHRRSALSVLAVAALVAVPTRPRPASAQTTSPPSTSPPSTSPPATSTQATSVAGVSSIPGVPIVVVEARGFGHGVGMAQDGALAMASRGSTTSQILAYFYPGTVFGVRHSSVRVPLSSLGALTLTFPAGGRVGDLRLAAGQAVTVRAAGDQIVLGSPYTAPTTTVAPPSTGTAARARTRPSTGFRMISYRVGARPAQADANPQAVVSAASTTPPTLATPIPTASSPVPTTPSVPPNSPEVVVAPPLDPVPPPSEAPSSSPIEDPTASTPPAAPTTPTDAVKTAGHMVRATASAGPVGLGDKRRYRGTIELTATGGGVSVVNELDVEDYLRGMGEVRDPKWPAAALRAQAIAARTYAYRTIGLHGEVCPTERCQVYLGAQAEFAEMNKAVSETAGKVLLYKGEIVHAYYSASGGGWTATAAEGFGGGTQDYPYLVARPYVTDNPRAATLRIPVAELGRRFGVNDASAVTVTRTGPSGRPLEITITGRTRLKIVSGIDFKKALGLRTTLYTLTTTQVGSLDELASTTAPFPDDVLLGDGVGPVDTPPVDTPTVDTPTADNLASTALPTTTPLTTTSQPIATPPTEPPVTTLVIELGVPTSRLPNTSEDRGVIASAGAAAPADVAGRAGGGRDALLLGAAALVLASGLGIALRRRPTTAIRRRRAPARTRRG